MNTHTNKNSSHDHNDSHVHDPYNNKELNDTSKNHEHYVHDKDLAPVARPTLLIFRFLVLALLIAGVLLLWRLLKTNNGPQQVAMTPEEVMEQVEDVVEDTTNNESFDENEEDLESSVEEENESEESSVSDEMTRLYIPLVSHGPIDGLRGYELDYGSWIHYAPYDVPQTLGVLSGTYRVLFDKNIDIASTIPAASSMLGNLDNFFFDKVELSDGIAVLYLSGTPMTPGHLGDVAYMEQIKAAAFQFNTVDTLVVMLNGQPYDLCRHNDADVSESGCDTTPRPWVVQR